LQHLDLAGMQLGNDIEQLIPAIQFSQSLLVVHLSNNSTSKEQLEYMFNILEQSMNQTYDDASKPIQVQMPDLILSSKDPFSTQNRLINH
jgi:hypothetical protein